ncbi:transporter [Desulfuromonas versatilis]|uniref:Transporter n=1 Tax=Desulfuromonas versatilis TaxID=2802975 RepID=A0ABN6E1U5_9BACT|nr:TolC family protein [Desulfuromonas versatilis]BCR06306.1 transporter [Desulfuromonas versatilis]
MDKKDRIRATGFRVWPTVLITFIVLALPSRGDCEIPAKQVLSLGQAVLIALKNNPGLNRQANAVASAEISASQQRTNFYPDLQITATGSKHFDKAYEQTTGQDENRNYSSINTELSSTVNLFNGFADIAGLKSAELELGAGRETLSREEQALAFETISSFIQVLTDQALIQVEEENLQENRKLLERIENLYQAGNLALSDLYQQQAETKQAELDLLEAKRTLNDSKLVLMQTLGLPPTTRYQVATPDFEKLSLPLADEDLDQMTLLALANRSDLKAQQRQIEAAGQQVRQARAGRLPKVDLFASLASDYTSLNEESRFSDQFMDDNPSATVGISVSVPLFDRYLTRTETAKATIEQRNEQLTLREKELQVGLEIAQALQDYRTTQKQVEVVETKLISARQSLQAYEERYRVGASTLVELTQARTQYVTAAFDQIQARHSLVTQEIALAYYLGDMEPVFAALELEKT